jgi:hypothetical protein
MRDTFPFRTHRTLAEVSETRRLQKMRWTDRTVPQTMRLANLLARAVEPLQEGPPERVA